MLSRRLIRIKVFQVLYAYRIRKESDPQIALNDINRSLDKMYEFYLFLLSLPSYLDSYMISEKDMELQKYFPVEQNIRSASVFSNHFFVEMLDENASLRVKTKKISFKWNQFGNLFESIFKNLKKQEFFIDYLVFDKPDKNQQAEFIIHLYGYLFETDDSFIGEMESLYFDLDSDLLTLYRMLKLTVEESLIHDELKLIEGVVVKDDELIFTKELCTVSAKNAVYYDDIIKMVTPNWDPDRIAVADIILLQMAITEFLHFPLIPVKVTINEYLDISKEFSTPKSHSFINGVLDRLKTKLIEEGKIEKSGRGLRDH